MSWAFRAISKNPPPKQPSRFDAARKPLLSGSCHPKKTHSSLRVSLECLKWDMIRCLLTSSFPGLRSGISITATFVRKDGARLVKMTHCARFDEFYKVRSPKVPFSRPPARSKILEIPRNAEARFRFGRPMPAEDVQSGYLLSRNHHKPYFSGFGPTGNGR